MNNVSTLVDWQIPFTLDYKKQQWLVVKLELTHFPQVKMKVTQSCPTLRDSLDCNPQDFSVHGILQAKLLEWVAIAFSEANTTRSNK